MFFGRQRAIKQERKRLDAEIKRLSKLYVKVELQGCRSGQELAQKQAKLGAIVQQIRELQRQKIGLASPPKPEPYQPLPEEIPAEVPEEIVSPPTRSQAGWAEAGYGRQAYPLPQAPQPEASRPPYQERTWTEPAPARPVYPAREEGLTRPEWAGQTRPEPEPYAHPPREEGLPSQEWTRPVPARPEPDQRYQTAQYREEIPEPAPPSPRPAPRTRPEPRAGREKPRPALLIRAPEWVKLACLFLALNLALAGLMYLAVPRSEPRPTSEPEAEALLNRVEDHLLVLENRLLRLEKTPR